MPNPPKNRLPEGLDHTHLRILSGLARGITPKQLRGILGAHRNTIDSRIKRIREFFGATHTPQAVYLAVKQKIVTPPQRQLTSLTPRQTDVLLKLIEGKTPLEIANELKISHKRVLDHFSDVRRANELNNWVHLAAYADQLFAAEGKKSNSATFGNLPKRDQTGLILAASGMNSREISYKLGTGRGATKQRIGKSFTKLGTSRRKIAATLGIGKKLPPEGVHLTAAEWQTLHAIVKSHVENSEISQVTKFSKNSVDNALRSVRIKIGFSNNTEVVVNAEEILASSGITSEQASAYLKDLKKKNGIKR